ncbi:unnamed protein product [Lymnaea stagnalis]|uniref:G-protein coupled receptors family 1 profile domain-containing protein n=1 Tax=Lymnaea stagnalis TaxID=6523 RepID=A0AAV2II89_LYMST
MPDFEMWPSLDYGDGDVDPHHRNYSFGDHELVGDAHVIDTHSAAYVTSGLLWVYAAPFVLVVGTIGSVLSLLVLCRKSMRSQTTMFYLAVLAVTDIMVLYTGLVRLWLEHAHDIYIRHHSDAACKLHTFVVYISLDCSAWILVAVSVDRCLYVTWPHRAKIWCTIRNARITVTAIAAAVGLVNLHFFWTYQLEGDEHNRIYSNGGMKCYAVTSSPFTVRFVENVWPWIDLCVYCLFPFLFMMISNGIIIQQLVRSERNMKSHAKRLFFRRSRSKSALKTRRQVSTQSNDVILTAAKDEPVSEKCANSHMILGFPDDLRTASDVLPQKSDGTQHMRATKNNCTNGGGAFLTVTQETRFESRVTSPHKETSSSNGAAFDLLHPKSYHASTQCRTLKSSGHDTIPLGLLSIPGGADDFINDRPCPDLLNFESRDKINNETKIALGISTKRDLDMSKSRSKVDKDSHTGGHFRGWPSNSGIPDYPLPPDPKPVVSPSSVSATFAFDGADEDILLGAEPRPVKSKVRSLIKTRTSHSCKVHPLRGTSENIKKSNHATSAETLRPDLLRDGSVCESTHVRGNIPNMCHEEGIPKCESGKIRGQIHANDVGAPNEISDIDTMGADTDVSNKEVGEAKDGHAYQNGGGGSVVTRAPGEAEVAPTREPPTSKHGAASAVSGEPQPATSSRRNTSNVSTTLLVVTVTFWVLNAPIVIFIVGYTYWARGADDQVNAQLFLAWAVVNILQYINNAIHLFLYCLTSPKFRQELMTMLKNLGVGVQQLKARMSRGGVKK